MAYSRKAYNKVKAINRRIADIAETYGTNSEAYRNFEKSIQMLFPDQAIGTSKRGFIRIKQGRKDIAALNKGLLKTVEKTTATRGEYNKKIVEEYKREYGDGKPTQEQLVEFSQLKQRVKDAADDGTIKKILSGDEDKRGVGSRKTYAELNAMLDEYEQQEREGISDAQNNYLRDSGEAGTFRSLTKDELKDIAEMFGDELEG